MNRANVRCPPRHAQQTFYFAPLPVLFNCYGSLRQLCNNARYGQPPRHRSNLFLLRWIINRRDDPVPVYRLGLIICCSRFYASGALSPFAMLAAYAGRSWLMRRTLRYLSRTYFDCEERASRGRLLWVRFSSPSVPLMVMAASFSFCCRARLTSFVNGITVLWCYTKRRERRICED